MIQPQDLLNYWQTQWDLGYGPPPLSKEDFREHWIQFFEPKPAVETSTQTRGKLHFGNQDQPAIQSKRPHDSRVHSDISTPQKSEDDLPNSPLKKGLYEYHLENIQALKLTTPSESTLQKPEPSLTKPSPLIKKTEFPTFESLQNYLDFLLQKGPYGNQISSSEITLPEGSLEAKIACVTLCPTPEEQKMGKLFVGEAGELFDKILAAIELQRSDVYLTSVWKNPQLNRTLGQRERTRWLPLFFRELELLSTAHLVIIGETCATEILKLGKDLEVFRQEKGLHTLTISHRTFKPIVTFHPQQLVQNPSLKRKAWEDWQWVKKTL